MHARDNYYGRLWELFARESIRDTLARYTWCGDHARLDEFGLAFCPDGVLEVPQRDPIRGRAAIIKMIAGIADRSPGNDNRTGTDDTEVSRHIVRHNVANIRFKELTPVRAEVDCYYTIFTRIGVDHFGRYRDVFVPIGDEWLISHRAVTTDWIAPHSALQR